MLDKELKEKLKDTDEVVILPGQVSIADLGYSESVMKSTDIVESITGDTIKQVQLEEADKFEIPSYIIDMSEINDVMPSTLNGLSTMLNGGDTAVYTKGLNGIRKIGYGESNRLYDELETYIKSVFGDKCFLYFNEGRGFKSIKGASMQNIILNI